MASIINASTAGAGGLISTADNSGVLQLQTAGTTAVTVDASQNVGIGTASPVSLLQVGSTATSNNTLTVASANNTAAQLNLLGDSSATYGTNLKYEGNGNYFAISLNNAGTLTEQMRIDSSGNLLVGTTSTYATGTSSFLGSGTYGVMSMRHSSSTAGRYHNIGPDASANFVVFNNNNAGVYLVYGNTSWSSSSDERLKTDLKPIENGLDKVNSLRSVTGRFKTDEESVSRSFLIAQDVQAVLPEAVNVQEDEQGTLGVQYSDVIPLLVASIKELKAIVDTQAEQIKALQGAQ